MGKYEFKLTIAALLISSIVDPLEAVTVNPALCPTNKIAPHKRHAGWQYGSARTFGAFYDLLAPGNAPYGAQNGGLQEKPQEDDPGDCGEIEDYDENDLSAITPQNNRRQGFRDSRGFGIGHFFGQNHHQRPPNYPERPPNFPERPPHNPDRPPIYPDRPPNYPQRPPTYPDRPPNYPQRPPQYPQRPPPNYPQRPPFRPQRPPNNPPRPPYWSGGLFGSNDYRPPLQEYPSDNVKPIHEYSDSNDVTYRPTVVGGSLGEVVGVSPVVPTTEETARPEFFPPRATTPSPNSGYPTTPRRPRSRNINSKSVIGSFVDLFFK